MRNRAKHIFLTLLLMTGVGTASWAQTIHGNVYGGGEMAKVQGSTNVTINKGKLGADIFGGGEGTLYTAEDEAKNPVNKAGTVSMSADVSGATYVTINGGEFAVRHMDTRDPSVRTDFAQHYNIYGGGNIASEVGETHVYVKRGMISKDSDGSGLGVHEDGTFLQNSNPVGIAQAYYHEGQMYFCIFGGGYGKNTSVVGDTWVDFHINDMVDINSTAIEDDLLEYQSYLDVIGGGYNGTVLGNTNVHVGGNAMCRDVFGGGLYATIGTEDDAETGKTNVYITGGNVDNVYGGGVMGDIMTSANTNIGLHTSLDFDGREYAKDNEKITVLMSVYGGNDVSGKVPTTNIYHNGGTIQQDLYGAGNGDYTGYYTPGLCDYAEGENDNYYPVDHSGDTSLDSKGTKGPKGNTYKGRPQTGNVNITIAGNSTTDKAMVLGQVFGGGNSCTMGAWRTDLSSKYDGDPHKWRDDPEYFLGGGNLNITIGSHIKIGRTHAELAEASDEDKEAYLAKGENVSGLYMGCSGRHLATETNEETSNSYHHYYDRYTAKYWPGFAVFADNGSPLGRAEGLAAFNAYMNNILIWSDNVNLNIANDVEDVWLSNFVGGGFRGSMKAYSATGQFHYSLPRGVTIGHAIVGGAYNTDVVYRVFDTEDDMHTYKEEDGHFVYRTTLKPEWREGVDYHHVEYAEDGETITGIVRFYYDGGILKSGEDDHRQQVILNAYNGGNSDLLEFAATAENEENEHALRYHKDKAILYLDLRCQLVPELIDGHVHGGNVFGGCFESGMVDGDLWTDYRCYIAPHWYGNENFNGGEKMFANAADYQNNFAMMLFGAGYGKNTTVKGDTYTRALYNKESGTATYPCLYNIFGGSFQGTVDGNTNIYYNVGQQGLCVGGLYGGGSQGYLSGKTFVELAGGYIANVYGGAREANIGKGVHVWAYDGALRNWGDDLPEHDDAPLVIERVFGGSDVSGLIGFTADATDINDESKRIKTEDAGREAPYTAVGWPEVVFNNYDPENAEHVSILESYNPTSYNEETGALKFRKFDSYVQIGGDTRGDRGYPLVGQIYAGGNGEKTDTEHGHILPGINTAIIELNDGNIMEAFGGGNKATVHEQNYIHTNGQHAPVSTITMPNALLSGILKNRVLKNVQDCYTLSGNTFTFKPNNVQRLFGGNNVAEMDIQPQWNLKAGTLGKVYSGGNMGNMTYYNEEGDAASAGQLNLNPKGLSIHVESDDIEIFELYGGCRLADVVAIHNGDTVHFDENDYGATVNISGGLIHTVYGGNDVAGHVHNGSNVNLHGAISGDVYGSGNGDYVYKYDTDKDAPAKGEVEERIHDNGYTYYAFRGTDSKADETAKIKAINAIRPNVDKAYLNIAGTDEKLVYVTGNVYCGGNASTVSGTDSHTKFDIGSNCVLNGVYMGSNGEKLADVNTIANLRAVNSISLNTAAVLKEYMNAVAMEALPLDFSIADSITDAYIGTFCLGGNRGSMTTNQPVHMTIPASVTIFDKIVGGCNNAYLSAGGTTTGGFITYNTDKTEPKITLDIYAKFMPRVMYVPEKNDKNYEGYKNQKFLYFPVNSPTSASRRFSTKICNVYGGCYTRGYVYGDVVINMYSDMLGDFLKADTVALYYTATNKKYSKAETAAGKMLILQNTIKYNETKALPAFSVFGGGYGSSTVIYGNTHIRLLNNRNVIGGASSAPHRDAPDPAPLVHPSVNAIYGGGEAGKMIGTSLIHIADGTVYSNVVGGALAGNIYGNTEILVGYPGYWEVQKTGEYKLKRSNFTAEELSKLDGSQKPKPAVKQSIFLTKGDRINAAIYQAIRDWDTEKHTTQADEANIKRVENKVAKNWDDIRIDIKGGIYGGGYSRADVEDGQTAMTNTVLNFTSSYNLATAHPEYWTKDNTLSGSAISKAGEYDYGGNATIWVQDEINAQNWKDGREHITISTDVETDDENNIHIGTGGIFGDGHSSLVAAFRSAAVEGYGYAEHPANNPKLLNTFQRFDILQIRDCSMKMYGQIDVATGQNDPTNYAVSRITELMLNSHIDNEQTLLATSELNARNVIDFYNPVHFLGSITSEVTFKPLKEGGTKYHDNSGNVVHTLSYYDYKSAQVAQNYDYSSHGIREVEGCKEAFGARNEGTAKNMIRIDDPEGRGMHLKVVQENNYAYNAQGVKEEQSFYGPLSGVFQFELTNVNARGGGYVYSNNLHQQTIDESDATVKGSKPTDESFLQTSGNVFFVPVHIASINKDRSVYDDCYPIPYSNRGDGELDKAHYWFVEGDGPTWCSYPQEPDKVNGTTITIETAEQLAWVYDYIDHGYDSAKETTDAEHYDDQHDKYPAGFKDWTIQLGNDIDLGQLTILDQREVPMIWCPIADQKDTYFEGTFDGNGHKIDGMLLDVDFITTKNTYGTGIEGKNYSNDYDHYFGLFAKTKGATIRNVELSDAKVKNIGGNENERVHIGTLITQVDGTTVKDCSVQQMDTVTTRQSNAVEAAAAFICHTDGDSSYIARNFVSGQIYAESSAVTAPVSGFISRLDNGSLLEHCYSMVDVTAQQVAGLADTVQGGAELAHAYYAGTLTRKNTDTNWGAILANAGAEATVKHCYYDITRNPEAKGYRGRDTEVFSSRASGYTSWSTFGLTTADMSGAEDMKVWRSCYSHGHDAEEEAAEYRCAIDAGDGTTDPHATAWNKGVWKFIPGFYPFLNTQEIDCSALTSAFAMPSAASLDLTTKTDLVNPEDGWYNIDKHFALPTYGNMYWTVANNTLLLDTITLKAQNKVDAHLYLGGPDALTLNCDEYVRWMRDIYVTREDINSPADSLWYVGLTTPGAKTALGLQLRADSLTLGMLRNKEVTNISKTKVDGKYVENGFDGDLHIWNRKGSAGTVTNPKNYTINGNITYYTGYTNPYLWQEVNAPFDVANTTVYRRGSGNEYSISARTSDVGEAEDGGNFWLRSFDDGATIQYGGSTFQQGWHDPADGEQIGHRPATLRFPKTMKVDKDTFLSGDYWCFAPENTIDGVKYHNGGSEIRFHSATKQKVYGTQDWEDNEDVRGAEGGYSFRVYGNPTLGNIQLEGYYWILETEKRDTLGINDPNVKPEIGTDLAQWFSIQQDPVIPPFGIWLDGSDEFKQQALDDNSSSVMLRLSPLHEPGVNNMFGEKEASFTASGYRGVLGVFSYIDQVINVFDRTGQLMFTKPVQANTGFTLNLPNSLFLVSGTNSPKPVKVLL